MTAAVDRPSPAGRLAGAVAYLRREGPIPDAVSALLTVALGLLFIAFDLVNLWLVVDIGASDRVNRWAHGIPLLVGGLAMLIKRHRPLLALTIGLLSFVGDLLIGGSFGMILVIFDLLYAAGYYTSVRVRRALWASVLIMVAGLSVLAGVLGGEPRMAVLMILQLGAVFVVPLWWASDVRHRAELAEVAAERAELERARAANLEQIATLETHEAVQAERAAMARDLHDVIASHLSATAIHSGAALAAPPDPVRDREALASVRASSLDALTEMRSMIMLLRTEQRPDRSDRVAAPARLSQLGELVDDAVDHGLQVDLERGPIESLPAAVDQAAYRIVQEALTNVIKYAPGSAVRLRIGVEDGRLMIMIENTVTSADQKESHPGLGSGTGLWSMRERAEALGGTLSAGPDGERWVVRGSIPCNTAASAGALR